MTALLRRVERQIDAIRSWTMWDELLGDICA
jgi:hypothetical protein